MFSSDLEKEFLMKTLRKHEKEEKGLLGIKRMVDYIDSKRITVTFGNDDFDTTNKVFDINVIIGTIKVYVYNGLGLEIPDTKK